MNRTIRTALASAAVVIAGGTAGLAAFGNTANAADSTGTTVTAPVADATPPVADATKPSGPHQANGITETPLVGDQLAKATAAAATAVPGSTVVRAETDADGDAFEVHISNADGTQSTVKLNADFSVKTVETGRQGGPGGQRPPKGTAPVAATTSTTA
jgi:hypothetical protein